jgi:hypothetical protein
MYIFFQNSTEMKIHNYTREFEHHNHEIAGGNMARCTVMKSHRK